MSAQSMFLDATDESVGQLLRRGISGPVTMLNLLQFRNWADHSVFPKSAPSRPVTGRDAYDRFINHALALLGGSSGMFVFFATGNSTWWDLPERDGTWSGKHPVAAASGNSWSGHSELTGEAVVQASVELPVMTS